MFHQMALDRNLPNGMECQAVMDVNGELACDIEQMKNFIKSGSGTKPVTYDVDHYYPGGENAKVIIKFCRL